MSASEKSGWDRILATIQENAAQEALDFGGRGVVVHSSELQRILSLPRRILDPASVFDCTKHFRKPGGTMEILPIQNACLAEAAVCNGLFAPVAVGAGKTLVTLLLAEAMNSKCAVLLVPPDLKKQLAREIEEVYGPHFHLPLDRLKILAYSQLSSPKFAEILDFVNPDLIIADECHNLRRKQSVRTKRFLDYMKEHAECRFAGLSGTVTSRSIRDYAHLIELALRKNSPLPGGRNSWGELLDWSSVLDADVPDYSRKRPGALKKLCAPGETVRQGFRRRLVQTKGVVATAEDRLGMSLIVRRLNPKVPDVVTRQMQLTEETWAIGEDELEDPMAMARVRKQLSQGFYYRWAWPNDEPDLEWIEARRAWHKEIRDFLTYHSRKGVDSPHLYEKAVIMGGVKSHAYADWAKVMDRKKPPTVPVWLDDFVIEYAIKWANKDGGIIWYEHKCIGEWLAQKSGFPHYGAGTDSSEATAPVIICSIRSQGTGKNLQYVYSRNLVLSMPSNGGEVQQLFGRTHRRGQPADEVTYDWLGHAEVLTDAIDHAVSDSQYVQETMERRKLLYCTRIDG